jgi:hypothetical protein
MVTPSPIKTSASPEPPRGSAPLQVTTGNTHAPCVIIGERVAETLEGLSLRQRLSTEDRC